METHKSLHICTDKGDWMLYPWLPSHVICIIFITKAFLFPPKPPASMVYTNPFLYAKERNTKQGQSHGGRLFLFFPTAAWTDRSPFHLVIWLPFALSGSSRWWRQTNTELVHLQHFSKGHSLFNLLFSPIVTSSWNSLRTRLRWCCSAALFPATGNYWCGWMIQGELKVRIKLSASHRTVQSIIQYRYPIRGHDDEERVLLVSLPHSAIFSCRRGNGSFWTRVWGGELRASSEDWGEKDQ